MGDPRYSVALLDWLACAAGGRDEPATRAARAAGWSRPPAAQASQSSKAVE